MQTISILGAGGFVGTSLVESLVLEGVPQVCAVVRAYRSFAGLARFGDAVDIQLADAEDSASLASVLEGSAAVVNLTTGPPAGIVRSTKAIYEACQRAGVRRLVHLSSAVVYGRSTLPNRPDDSPPLTKHWMPYARAKAKSEDWLRPRIGSAAPEVIVLRPGIVWGPKSPHTLQLASDLLHKRAFLVNDGQGVFNAIYIDNLIACIRASIDDDAPGGGYYNVSDAENLTWRDFYAGLGRHLDFDMSRIAKVSRLPMSAGTVIDYVQQLPLVNSVYHQLKQLAPDHLKSAIKARLAGHYEYRRTASDYAETPAVDREVWHLQQVEHKLPSGRFCQLFDCSPAVGFEEGLRRTVCWLAAQGHIQPQESLTS